MPISKMSYNDCDFWIAEHFMQIMYHYIYKELVKPEYIFTDKEDFLYETRFHIDGYSTGIMWLGWGKFVNSEAEIQTMIRLLENVKSGLLKEEYISVEELQAIPSEDTFFKSFNNTPLATSEFVRIANALISLLNGTWAYNNHDLKIDPYR